MNKVDREHSRKQKMLRKAERRALIGDMDPRVHQRLGAHSRQLAMYEGELEHPAGTCPCLRCRKARGEE